MKRIAAVVVLSIFATAVIAQGSPKAVNPELVNPNINPMSGVQKGIENANNFPTPPTTTPTLGGGIGNPNLFVGGAPAVTGAGGVPFVTGAAIVGGAAVIGGVAAATGGSSSSSTPGTAGTGGTSGTR